MANSRFVQIICGCGRFVSETTIDTITLPDPIYNLVSGIVIVKHFGEEVCKLLRLSTRTLQEYRNSVTLPFYKIGGKILYKQSDIQAMLERHYNPIPKKLWQV